MRQRLACAACRERITSTIDPQHALRTRATRNVILECARFVGLLGITTTCRSLGIELVCVVNDIKGRVATACDVQLVVDNAVAKSARSMRVRVSRCEICPSVEYWIVLPRGILGTGYVSRVVAEIGRAHV